MADNEFDLGEAYGSLQQANADRNFYLSMVQGGNTAASPIAAYLAGVAGVKMATATQQYQQAREAKEQDEDAKDALYRARRHQDNMLGQMRQILTDAGEGKISKGAAAVMLQPVAKELGYRMYEYDPDEGTVSMVGSDNEPFTVDLGIGEKAKASIDKTKSSAASGAKPRYTTLSSFNASHKDVNNAFGKDFLMKRLTKGQVQAFIEGFDGLSENDKKSVQPKVDELLSLAAQKGWSFSSPTTAQNSTSFDLNSLWGE